MIHFKKVYASAAFFVFLFASCASTKSGGLSSGAPGYANGGESGSAADAASNDAAGSAPLNKVYVTNTKKVPLLAPDALQGPRDCYEYFTGTFGEKTFASLCYLNADEDGISVVLMNEFGMEMGTLVYDGKSAALNSSLFPKKLKSEYILLDLQNVLYDAEKLSAHYKNYGLDFSEKVLEDGTVLRELKNKKKLIEKITVTLNKEGARLTRIENLLRGYVFELSEVLDE